MRLKLKKSRIGVSGRALVIGVYAAIVASIAALCAGSAILIPTTSAQTVVTEAGGFRIGERLTYTVTIGRLPNAAYAELYCVSRGRLGEKDAIELRAKFRTLDLASATFHLIDESRTTFVNPSTGVPLFTSVTQNTFGLPKETTQSFLQAPTPHFDLLTMIYKLRQSGGTGAVTMQDGEKVYSVTFLPGGIEKQKTDAGEFETAVVSVQSEYFAERAMTDVRVYLSNDEAKVPVVVSFGTSKGKLRAALASAQMIEPEVATSPTPVPIRTPLPERTPKPPPTPEPYVANQELSNEIAFDLGERLDYRVTFGGQQVAAMHLHAKERKQVNGLDSLLLEATFTNLQAGSPFAGGDFVRAYVSPDTLAPQQFETRFAGALRPYSGTLKFEREGSLVVAGPNRIDSPVGTHSILSLLYAARSFNLKPSRDLNNPINDTRVAVFWESQPYIFTLRPSQPEILTIDGKQVPAQLVTVSTKNPTLDQLNIRIWLGMDDSRVPVRFAVGAYQADLVSATKVAPN
jgi:hypothetical protein